MNEGYDLKMYGRRENGKSIVSQIILISCLNQGVNTTIIHTTWGSGDVSSTVRKQIQSTGKEPIN